LLSENEIYFSAALGMFDGLHAGHLSVLKKSFEIARESGLRSAVFTFSVKNDAGVVFPEHNFILSDRQKEHKLRSMGFDKLMMPRFSEIKDTTAEDFLKDYLINQENIRAIICGEDFRFGKNAACDADGLKRLAADCGIEVFIVPLLKDSAGVKISSTRIREDIKNGNFIKANTALGFCYAISGIVIDGSHLGRTLGFPTANIEIPKEQILPRLGVYKTTVTVSGRNYLAITNVGQKPTIPGERKPLAESFLIDFDGDLYGTEITVTFEEFIRPEMKFDNLEDLKKQMIKDSKIYG
jgi:riboflavin kinase/FMN adenylyltransferase